jgi:hypothetical protein
MDSQLRTEPLGIVILALAFATVGLSACNDEPADIATIETQSYIGTKPAPPTAPTETPTPIEPNQPAQSSTSNESTISKEKQSKDMPLPGQANDHSNLAPNPTQKSPEKPAAR